MSIRRTQTLGSLVGRGKIIYDEDQEKESSKRQNQPSAFGDIKVRSSLRKGNGGGKGDGGMLTEVSRKDKKSQIIRGGLLLGELQ